MNIFSRNPFSRQPGRAAEVPSMSDLASRPGTRWAALALLVLLIAFAGILGYQSLQAKSSLEQARNYAQQAKDALLSGKAEDATRLAENAGFYARQARATTHTLPWNVAAAVPLVGSPLKTTQQISDVVVSLTDEVLLPAARMGATVSPDKLIVGTRIDLNVLRAEQPRLSELSAAATKLDADAQSISNPGYLSRIRDARSQLQDQTYKLAQTLRNAALAAQLAPSMLGADGPRTYLMGFQTPAEARGTGGLLGGFGVLRFENGAPIVDTLAPNTDLKNATAAVDLGAEFNKEYGWTNPYTDFRNSNLSPHFPYAAQIWRSMWERESGLTVDGVIAIDPVVLSYVLGAIGPVTLPNGEEVNAGNVVELTMSTAYLRFPRDPIYGDTNARKKYLQDIAAAVVQKMTGPLPGARNLLAALGRAASEGRIAIWSASPPDQALLLETPLAHVVPDDDAPYAQVVVNNLAGGKMDYYLRREIEYAADGCDGDMRNSTVTVRLTNTATMDQPLTDYVGGTSGLTPALPIEVPTGTMVSSVRVIATKGAKLISVTSDGERTTAIAHVENGRPSFEVQVVIPPGTSGELTFRLSEPTSPGAARVPVQPLIDTPPVKLEVPTCQ